MLNIRQLDHLVLRVRALAPMLAFYREVLGCPLEREQPELGLYQLRAGSSLIDLVTVDGPLGRAGGAAPSSDGRNLDHLCLRLERFDFAQIREHLQRHGVAVGELARRYGADGYGPSIYIQDPEGNIVELKGPPDDAGAMP